MPRQTAIRTIWSNERVLVVDKPSGLPCAPLSDDPEEPCLVNVLRLEEPRVMVPQGRLVREGGLVHRLDTPTRGLVLFALDQEAYDMLSAEQKRDGIVKQYRAIFPPGPARLPEGFPEYPYHDVVNECGLINSYFRSYGPKGASVRPTLDPKAKNTSPTLYTTQTEAESPESVICTLTRGFRHQVRAHLAWSGHPLLGDTRYGGPESQSFGLEAVGISFTDPSDGSYVTITL